MYDTAFLTHVKYECFNLIGVMRQKWQKVSDFNSTKKAWNVSLGDKLPLAHSSLHHRQDHFQIDCGRR